MAIGWIKLHRQIFENKFWFAEKFTKAQAWVDLLLLANHTPQTIFIRGVEIQLKTGQLCYSKKTLASRWKWNYATVTNFLDSLHASKMVTTKTNNVSTVISINLYQRYQASNEQSNYQSNEQNETKVTTDNNDKNVKNDNNKIIPAKTRAFSDKQKQYQEIITFLEERLETKFPNYVKQTTALQKMFASGYTQAQIQHVIEKMASEDFYRDKGFDMMTVANQIALYKAKARKAINV